MVVGEDEAETNLVMILEKLLLCVWNFCISRQYYYTLCLMLNAYKSRLAGVFVVTGKRPLKSRLGGTSQGRFGY